MAASCLIYAIKPGKHLERLIVRCDVATLLHCSCWHLLWTRVLKCAFLRGCVCSTQNPPPMWQAFITFKCPFSGVRNIVITSSEHRMTKWSCMWKTLNSTWYTSCQVETWQEYWLNYFTYFYLKSIYMDQWAESKSVVNGVKLITQISRFSLCTNKTLSCNTTIEMKIIHHFELRCSCLGLLFPI